MHGKGIQTGRPEHFVMSSVADFVRGVPLSWMQFVHWHRLGISPKWEEEGRGGLSVYVYFLYVLNVWI